MKKKAPVKKGVKFTEEEQKALLRAARRTWETVHSDYQAMLQEEGGKAKFTDVLDLVVDYLDLHGGLDGELVMKYYNADDGYRSLMRLLKKERASWY